MDTLKSLVMELIQNPVDYSIKNWVTAAVILVVVWNLV